MRDNYRLHKAAARIKLLTLLIIMSFALAACEKTEEASSQTGGQDSLETGGQEGEPDGEEDGIEDGIEGGESSDDGQGAESDQPETEPGDEKADDGDIQTPAEPAREPVIVGNDTISKEVRGEDGALIFSINMDYPMVTGGTEQAVAEVINQYYSALKEADIKDEQSLVDWAKEEYESLKSKENWSEYAMVRGFEVTINNGYILGIRSDGYSSTGAAYPSSFAVSDNFDLLTGETIKLNTMVEDMEAMRTYIVDCIKQQIDQKGLQEGMFPEYEEYLNADEDWMWYLTEEELVLIFNEYSLGPHALGIMEFPIELEELSGYWNDYGKQIIGIY